MTPPPATITVHINGTPHQIDPDQAMALRDELCRILGRPDGTAWYPPVRVPFVHVNPRAGEVYCGQSTTNATKGDWTDITSLGSRMELP